MVSQTQITRISIKPITNPNEGHTIIISRTLTIVHKIKKFIKIILSHDHKTKLIILSTPYNNQEPEIKMRLIRRF